MTDKQCGSTKHDNTDYQTERLQLLFKAVKLVFFSSDMSSYPTSSVFECDHSHQMTRLSCHNPVMVGANVENVLTRSLQIYPAFINRPERLSARSLKLTQTTRGRCVGETGPRRQNLRTGSACKTDTCLNTTSVGDTTQYSADNIKNRQVNWCR